MRQRLPRLVVLVVLSIALCGSGNEALWAAGVDVSALNHQLLDDVQLWTVACQSPLRCITAGGQTVPNGQQLVFSTSDGGATWGEIPHPQGMDINHLTCPTSHRCFGIGVHYDATTGAAQSSLLLTQPPKLSWASFPVEELNSAGGSWAADLSCPSSRVCFVAGTRYVTPPLGPRHDVPAIAITANAGQTWRREALTNDPNISLETITCPRTNICLVGGYGREHGCALAGVILRTADGGQTWDRQYDSCAASITSLACPRTSTCYAGGYYGDAYRYANQLILGTTDSGWNWTSQLRSPFKTTAQPSTWIIGPIQSMVCPGVSECFAVEQNSVLGTTDAGRTWSIEKGVDDAFLTSISCPTVTRCIAVGSVGAADPGLDVHPMSGLIVRTDDGGKTWTSLP